MKTQEINIDRLIGPNHFFGGLGVGNVASQQSAMEVAHPKAAALAALDKMYRLVQLGAVQYVWPFQQRPHWMYLGLTGLDDEHTCREILNSVDIQRLLTAYSSSAMWVANAATISPSVDTMDGRCHVTPANLAASQHRYLELDETVALLRYMFQDERFFRLHAPVDAQQLDEGAANHCRLFDDDGASGVHLFVAAGSQATQRFPGRQHVAAQKQIAKQHSLAAEHVVFATQHPEAIDAGVFHNDVIMMSHRNCVVLHEQALLDQEQVLDSLIETCAQAGFQLISIVIPKRLLSLAEAVRSYFFNSQFLQLDSKTDVLFLPVECQALANLPDLIQSLQDQYPRTLRIEYVDVRESMMNGGGPACLRLRVWLKEQELAALPQQLRLTAELYSRLATFIESRYPESLSVEQFRSLDFARQCDAIYREQGQVLGLPEHLI